MENIIKLIVGFFLIIFIGFIGYQVYAQASSDTYMKLSRDLAEINEKNAELAAQNALLLVRINALKSDNRAIERKVRDELGMARNDEVIILFHEPKDELP